MKPTRLLYALPGLVAMYYVAHALYYRRGIEYYGFPEILLALLMAGVYAYLVVLAVNRKNQPANLLVASVILVVTLFYGYFRDSLLANPGMNAVVRHYFWGKYNAFFILLTCALTGISILLFRRFSGRAAAIGKFLFLFFCALIAMDIFMFYNARPVLAVRTPSEPDTFHLAGAKPDVYFIVFDSEPRSSSLKQYWNYTNDSADNELMRRGFFLARNAKSNYNWTPFSIASTLNMSYLPDNSAVAIDEDFPETFGSRILNIFADNGYSVYNLSFFRINKYPALSPVLHHNVWEKTLFYFLYDRASNFKSVEYCRTQKELFWRAYDSLESLADNKAVKPKFVYAHFMIPHPPAFFDRYGNDHIAATLDSQDMNAFLDQVVYSYQMIFRLIERIQRSSNGNAIIIIQGDHGYRFLEGPQKWNEQYDICYAAYFPNKDYSLLSDSATSVNTFRVVLNSQFGTTLPMLQDSSFNILTNILNTLR